MKPWCRVSGLGHWGSHQALLLGAEETGTPLRSHLGRGRFLSEYRPHHPAALFLAPQCSAFQQTMWLLPVLLVSGLPLLGTQARQAPLPVLYSSSLYSAQQQGLGNSAPYWARLLTLPRASEEVQGPSWILPSLSPSQRCWLTSP